MTVKCTLCFEPHDRKWQGEEPAMYCHKCAKIKGDSEGVITQITPNIYLSGMEAAATFTKGHRICVHERVPNYSGQVHHIPILAVRPNSSIDRTGGLVDLDKLRAVLDLMEWYDANDHAVLVHCVGGVERSPLVIAYYLTYRTNRFSTLTDSYEFIKQKRPVVSDRQFWLPPQYADNS